MDQSLAVGWVGRRPIAWRAVVISCLSLWFTVVCAAVPRVIAPLQCPAEGMPAARDSADGRPIPHGMRIPSPPPRGVVQRTTITIRLMVDTLGQVMKDSTMVCGAPSRQYASRVASQMADLTFDPAKRGGRPVVASVTYTFNFNQR